MTDIGELKHRIRTEWAKLDHAVIAALLLCISGVVVSQRASRPAAVISSRPIGFFYFDIVFVAITATFLAVVDQSNSCTPICRFGLSAVVSYDFVLCNKWRLSNLQGKVATLIRLGGFLLR